MNPSEIRRAAIEYIRGRSVLRAAFPELRVEALDALALVVADDTPVLNLTHPAVAQPAVAAPARRASTRRNNKQTTPTPVVSTTGRSALEVDVGGTRIPLIDAVVGVFQQKPRGVELTLADIVDEFNALGWKLLTRNADWTFPIRDRIKKDGVGLLTWRSSRPAGQRHARDMFTMANARNVALSPESRTAIDESCRSVVQHLSTMN